MAQEFNDTETLFGEVKEYLNTRLSQLKLSGAEKTSKVMALMIAVVMSALVFFLVFVLISVAGAIAIGQRLENYWLGFLMVAVVVLVLGFLLWLSRDRLLRIPIMNALIKIMFDKDDEKD
jgi:drug/metabolite transporter (DMT)-like permease